MDQQPHTRSTQRPRRRETSPPHRSHRTGGILVAGAGAWALLALLGVKGVWTTALVLGVTGLGVVWDRSASAAPRGARRHPERGGRAAWREGEVAPANGRAHPNAVSEAYNTLSPAPPQGRPSIQPDPVIPERPARAVQPETTLGTPAPDGGSKMPPPVPPPLLSRPGLKPILAGYPISTPTPEPAEQADPEPQMETLATEALELPDTVNADVWVDPTPSGEPVPDAEVTEPQPFLVDPLFDLLPFEEAAPAVEEVPEALADAPQVSIPAPPPCPEAQEPVAVSQINTYALPSYDMLPLPPTRRGASDDEILERASLLEHTLKTFGVEARVVDFAFGPAVTRYELQPGPGVRVNKFTSLVDDLALALAAEDIRIEAPIPGKSAVGIEVPNKKRLAVPLREVLESPQFRENPSKLAVAFGKDNAGNPVVGDLTRMPHLLIAGSTGSGKSVCMNSIICSLLFKAQPNEVKMLMIDPKMVELSTYNGIPHLMAPVLTDVKKAAGYLKGAVKEMEGRYELFAAAGVRNIEHYNRMVAADPGPDPEHPRQPLPYIVIFIDELADLMMVAPADVEDSICRLAQMARACGMHLVIATQSPRVDVITGLIKANVPSRIAFAVSSQIDSRVIMDSAGAERLLGRGDMLYHPSGMSKPLRAQGAFIDESSVEQLVRFVKAQGSPVFTAQEVAVEMDQKNGRSSGGTGEKSQLSAVEAAFPEAVRIVIEHGQASVSILQRRLRCNYNKASRLIDMMEEQGFVGPHQGSKPRDVLVSMADWQALFSDLADDDDETDEVDDT